MRIRRRDVLKGLAAAPVLRLSAEAVLQQAGSSPLRADDPVVVALAEVVLPAECDRRAAIAGFVRWLDNYKEGADTDHGYGNTRIRSTAPSPARNYAAQIAALDAAARTAGAQGFAAASAAQRRTIVEAALASAGIERLPGRPNGAHIASDLMGHYFNSSAANDLCYRAAIERDACRGLDGSERPPKGADPRAQR